MITGRPEQFESQDLRNDPQGQISISVRVDYHRARGGMRKPERGGARRGRVNFQQKIISDRIPHLTITPFRSNLHTEGELCLSQM